MLEESERQVVLATKHATHNARFPDMVQIQGNLPTTDLTSTVRTIEDLLELPRCEVVLAGLDLDDVLLAPLGPRRPALRVVLGHVALLAVVAERGVGAEMELLDRFDLAAAGPMSSADALLLCHRCSSSLASLALFGALLDLDQLLVTLLALRGVVELVLAP
jgi:hypothetical protein